MTDLLSIVTTSEKRKNLLLLLQQGPKTMDEIRATLKVTTTGMLPQIKVLNNHGMVRKTERGYVLTEMGEVVAAHLDHLVGTLSVIGQEEKFWREHDISAIPPSLRMRLSELGRYRIITYGDEELFESHGEFREQILRSKVVRGFAPIIHPIYPQFFLALAQKGVEISLILSESVFGKIEKRYGDQLHEGLKYPNASLYVTREEVRLAFIVTDLYLSLTLFFQDGRFDNKMDVSSFDPSALAWGRDLFTHILERSRQVPAQ
jgi:predicted transcriptional regulator